MLKGTTACCLHLTVCYLLGNAPLGVLACISISRVGLCRVCIWSCSAHQAVLTLRALSLDLLGLLKPIVRTEGLGQGYCALKSVFSPVLLGFARRTIVFCAKLHCHTL